VVHGLDLVDVIFVPILLRGPLPILAALTRVTFILNCNSCNNVVYTVTTCQNKTGFSKYKITMKLTYYRQWNSTCFNLAKRKGANGLATQKGLNKNTEEHVRIKM
jgi:hypothetical protein